MSSEHPQAWFEGAQLFTRTTPESKGGLAVETGTVSDVQTTVRYSLVLNTSHRHWRSVDNVLVDAPKDNLVPLLRAPLIDGVEFRADPSVVQHYPDFVKRAILAAARAAEEHNYCAPRATWIANSAALETAHRDNFPEEAAYKRSINRAVPGIFLDLSEHILVVLTKQ